jgi:hypothetical protein
VSEDTLPYAEFKFVHDVACKQLVEVDTARKEGMRKGILTQSEFFFQINKKRAYIYWDNRVWEASIDNATID